MYVRKVYTEVRNNILNQVHIYKYSEKGLSTSTIFRKGGGVVHTLVYILVYILSLLSKRGHTPSKILT